VGARVDWTSFANVRGLQSKPPLVAHGAYGALFTTSLPATSERIAIAIEEALPAPAPEHAAWSH
jgi:hypothetical protein